MTEAEISRRLALAIGWADDQDNTDVVIFGEYLGKKEEHCCVWFEDPSGEHYWREFDYRDPAVIWPIAERFNAFPLLPGTGYHWTALVGFNSKTQADADAAAKAVALAVIKAHEVKK